MLHFRRLIPLLALAVAVAAGGCTAPSTGPAPAAAARELEAIFADTAFRHAHWGVAVESAETGAVLFEQNRDKFFMPASNMKLATGAAALEALGPDYRFRTTLAASGPIRNGVLQGDLVVIGGGDPTISARFGEGDARTVFRAWADSLRAKGVQRVAGSVVGVDTAFDAITLGRGWAWDDLGSYYAAEISALEFNEGAVQTTVFPGSRTGVPGAVSFDPPTGYLPVDNGTVTIAAGGEPDIDFDRDPNGPGIIVTGEIPADTFVQRDLAVRDPTRFFVSMLRETLRSTGIAVDGPAMVMADLHEPARAPEPVFVHQSPPLREVLPGLMKPSQNQIAEIFLKTLGRELRGAGTSRDGVAAVDSIFRSWGLPAAELIMADGSGLSRYNYVTPELLMGLLKHMLRSPNWEVWYASLPIAGIDGTLRNRFRDTPAEGRIRAKTGTIANTRALSGYLNTESGEWLVFSMIVNNSDQGSRNADRLVEEALLRLVTEPARVQ